MGTLLLLNTVTTNNMGWRQTTEKNLNTLIPEIAVRLRMVLEEMERNGNPMMVTDGYRTWAEQNALYAKGRTKAGNVVTNARGGQSWHNYKCAADCTFVINGRPSWDGKLPWAEYGRVAKKYGFEWGGDWRLFKDRPHVQMRFGLTLRKVQNMGEKRAIADLTQLANGHYPIRTAPSSWAKDAVEWSKTFGIEDWNNPQQPVTQEMLSFITEKLKLSSKVYKDADGLRYVSKEQLLTILYRLMKK